MKRTTNYSLPTWGKTDFIKMDGFNDLTQKTDSALASHAASLAEKATASASQNLGAHGRNARIAVGSYTGTGAYGSANPNTLQFDFKPALVFITIANWDGGIHNPSLLMRPRATGSSRPVADSYSQLTVTLGNRSVAWYMNGKESPYYQLNVGGQLYYYTAIGYDE